MEQVLDVYKRPYDPRHPVVCMDESPRQLIRETRLPLAAGPGAPARHDFEYERCGVCKRVHGRRAVGQQENGPGPGTENQNGLGTLSQRHGPALPLRRKDYPRDGQSEYSRPRVAL